MVDRFSDAWSGRGVLTPTTADRLLIGLCAAVWLTLVGMSVAAIVALMDLGRGFQQAKGNPHTSAVLYAVIIISALIILAAIPMLVRARRITRDGDGRPAGPSIRSAAVRPVRSGHLPVSTTSAQDRTERLTALGPALPDATVDRIWLRGTVALMSTMGAALVAVATATYSMAIGHNGFAWTGYGIAGFVTLLMPVIEWLHVRRLRRMLAG